MMTIRLLLLGQAVMVTGYTSTSYQLMYDGKLTTEGSLPSSYHGLLSAIEKNDADVNYMALYGTTFEGWNKTQQFCHNFAEAEESHSQQCTHRYIFDGNDGASKLSARVNVQSRWLSSSVDAGKSHAMITIDATALVTKKSRAGDRGQETSLDAYDFTQQKSSVLSAREVLVRFVHEVENHFADGQVKKHDQEFTFASRWSLQPRPMSSFWESSSGETTSIPSIQSLDQVVLSNRQAFHKKRVFPPEQTSLVQTNADAELWAYREAHVDGVNRDYKALFLRDTLRLRHVSTPSNTASDRNHVAHAEAFVHPALLAHPRPLSVAFISEAPSPTVLCEILKYDTIRNVAIVGATEEIKQLIRVVYETDDDAMKCLSDQRVEWIKEDADSWLQSVSHIDVTEKLEENEEQEEVLYDLEMVREMDICHDEGIRREMDRNGYLYEREVYCPNAEPLANGEQKNDATRKDTQNHVEGRQQGSFDVILVDVSPLESLSPDTSMYQKWLSVDFHTQLRGLLSTHVPTGDDHGPSSMLVVNAGSAPAVPLGSDSGQEGLHGYLVDDSRAAFLEALAFRELNYGFTFVYDEFQAATLDTSFFIAFLDDNAESYYRFHRKNPYFFDTDLMKRLSKSSISSSSTTRRPTAVYDGPTHVSYLQPSRAWESWFCGSAGPGKDLYTCDFLTERLFDPENHHSNTRVNHDPVKGRSLRATEGISAGDFVQLEHDNLFSLFVDQTEWDALLDFVEAYPDAAMYRQLRDYIIAYGYEVYTMGVSGWAVSLACTNTFTNHACSVDVANVAACTPDREFEEVRFSPAVARRPHMTAITSCATRDIKEGEELQLDYISFRSEPEKRPYFLHFLNSMCHDGVGMVPVDRSN